MIRELPVPHRVAVCSAASIGMHAAFGVIVFLGLGIAASSSPPPGAQMVLELAALPSAPPHPNEAPLELERKKSAPKPTIQKIEAPVLKVALDAPPEIAVASSIPPTVSPEQSDKPAEETTKAETPDALLREAPKAPATGMPSRSTSKAQQSWESRLLAALERKKRYPAAAQRLGQQDVVYVRLSIDATGRLVDGQIRRSQGFPMLDEEVISLVHRASPFSAPPADEMNGQSVLALVVPVEFFINSSSRNR